MKLLLLVVLVWTASDEASADRNLALDGRATMSSIWMDPDIRQSFLGVAMNGIDGNTDSVYFHGSCFHTGLDSPAWYRVDLLRTSKISSITITNRGDFGSRTNGAEIRIGDSLANNGNNNPRCALVTSIADGETRTFQCNNMVGRYVNIVLTGKTEFLHLCEVQIFGENLPRSFSCQYSNDGMITLLVSTRFMK
uniref:Ranaspumin-4 n=1 Tax=Engystomops pustulosus TaxID=76066 RepID=B5DCK4_ENGPU|nr:ranaspumin-4 [Engystomops pustulosus]